MTRRCSSPGCEKRIGPRNKSGCCADHYYDGFIDAADEYIDDQSPRGYVFEDNDVSVDLIVRGHVGVRHV